MMREGDENQKWKRGERDGLTGEAKTSEHTEGDEEEQRKVRWIYKQRNSKDIQALTERDVKSRTSEVMRQG